MAFVRVRLDNGTEKSVPEAVALRYNLEPLDKPTHGRDGRMLPPKPRVPLGMSASAAPRKSRKTTSATKSAAADESQED